MPKLQTGLPFPRRVMRHASHALDTAKYQETKHIELLLRACCSCELSAPVSVCVVCVSCLRPVVSNSD